ncbi:MAG TPA: hypothetical protein VFU40_10665 [Gemmatimonadales bacterium]|nr:hypothetical protein [Gemmatimonadales bacterium]
MLLWSWILGTTLAVPLDAPPPAPTVTVSVDSSRHEVIVTSGPYDLPNMPPMDDHAMMDLGMSHDTRLQRFEWPVDGWFRGFRVELADAGGRPVPAHVMHHMIMVNFSRRQLLYSAAERLMGTGTETEEVSVPKTIGVPMKPGMKLGMYIAWHNDTGQDLDGVRLKLTMLWTPKNQNPPPVNALPIYMDVNLTVGGTNTFDVPPGKSAKSYEFSLPVGGRLLGVGGHMHDYGTRVRLEDVESGKVLTQVLARRDSAGKLVKVGRKLFGVSGEGLRLKKNRRYRVVGEYDNPTGQTLYKGAMASMVGLFVPDDMKRWPAIDPRDPTYRRDLASLEVRGTDASGMHHHGGQASSESDHTDGAGHDSRE